MLQVLLWPGSVQNVSWAGVWCKLPLPTIVPAASATGTHPSSRSSAEPKVPLLLPSTCFGSESLRVWVFIQALTAAQSGGVSGSVPSAKTLNSIPHLWVTSPDDFGCFYRNMAGECCPGKHYFGVMWSIHCYTSKTAFDSCKLLGGAFDGLL